MSHDPKNPPQTGTCAHGRPYPHTGVSYCRDCAAEHPVAVAARQAAQAKVFEAIERKGPVEATQP